MKAATIALILVATLMQATATFALSTPIGRDINFPKDYDHQKAKAIRRVVAGWQSRVHLHRKWTQK